MHDVQTRLKADIKREKFLLEQIRRLSAEYQHLFSQGQNEQAENVVEQLEVTIGEYAKERNKNSSIQGKVIMRS